MATVPSAQNAPTAPIAAPRSRTIAVGSTRRSRLAAVGRALPPREDGEHDRDGRRARRRADERVGARLLGDALLVERAARPLARAGRHDRRGAGVVDACPRRSRRSPRRGPRSRPARSRRTPARSPCPPRVSALPPPSPPPAAVRPSTVRPGVGARPAAAAAAALRLRRRLEVQVHLAADLGLDGLAGPRVPRGAPGRPAGRRWTRRRASRCPDRGTRPSASRPRPARGRHVAAIIESTQGGGAAARAPSAGSARTCRWCRARASPSPRRFG